MTVHASNFATDFRERVIPRMHRQARVEAYRVLRGVRTWSQAWDAMMGLARSRGALHLPARAVDDLEDWISTTLLAEIDAAEREVPTHGP